MRRGAGWAGHLEAGSRAAAMRASLAAQVAAVPVHQGGHRQGRWLPRGLRQGALPSPPRLGASGHLGTGDHGDAAACVSRSISEPRRSHGARYGVDYGVASGAFFS